MSAFRPATATSGSPLMALSAVVMDTETTGLDPEKARVLQIGAVKIDHGKLDPYEFETLVNPQEPIPPASTAIHGLSDTDVNDAPGFSDAMSAFADFAGERVLIGHTIAFDLTILRGEHERAGISWTAPRSLCTALLTRATGTILPAYSIKTITEWLGIDVIGRHTALGDARATAEVFIKLVPLLREKGIRTLAEAEAASKAFSHELEQQRQAGWDQAGASDDRGRIGPLARVDSYPYRHRVHEIMSAPAIKVPPSHSLGETLKLLMERKISSVFVEADGKTDHHGILTGRDLLRALHSDGAGALAEPVSKFMSTPLDSVDGDSFAYRALGRMARRNVRHLGVVDEDGKLVGAITSRNLLRQRAQDALIISDGLDAAESVEELGVVWAELPVMARSLLDEGVDPRHIAAIVSHELCGLTRRSAELGEMQLIEDGAGKPPCAYSVLVLGSAGRGESLLAMDQDNAIVYEQGEPDGPEDQWFARLGAIIADTLHAVGVPHCKGGIMASNAQWRMSLDRWHETISDWMQRAKPEDLLNTDIFFDLRPVHGDRALGFDLWRKAYDIGHQSTKFQQLLTMTSGDFSVPLGWFGRFRTGDQGRVDLKAGGLMPIFSAARVLSIRHDIRHHSTPERLQALSDRSDMSQTDIDNAIEAHKRILGAILNQQLHDLEDGIQLSNKVDPRRLPRTEQRKLHWAVEHVDSVRGLLGNPMAWG